MITVRIGVNNILILLRSSYDNSIQDVLTNLLFFYQVSSDITFLMLLTVPFFIHYLLAVPFRKAADIIFIILIAFFFIINAFPYLYGIFGGLADYPVMFIADAQSVLMIITFVYLGSTLLFFYPKSPDMQKKRTALAIFCFFVSFTLFDFLTAKNTFIFIRPGTLMALSMNIGFYTFWNLFFLLFVSLTSVPGNVEISPVFTLNCGISERELEIIRMVLSGKSNREIADRLFISEKTVKNHMHNIFQKTGVKSRMQLSFFVRDFSK